MAETEQDQTHIEKMERKRQETNKQGIGGIGAFNFLHLLRLFFSSCQISLSSCCSFLIENFVFPFSSSFSYLPFRHYRSRLLFLHFVLSFFILRFLLLFFCIFLCRCALRNGGDNLLFLFSFNIRLFSFLLFFIYFFSQLPFIQYSIYVFSFVVSTALY